MKSRNHMKDVVVSGFALFAIFFGAGNLIFPPMLGNMTGTNWFQAMLGFLSTDPLLPILAVIATAFVGGRAQDLGKRISPLFARVLAAVCILLIAPVLSVPRTAATTFEIAIKPYLPEANVPIAMVLTSVIFFAITYYFSINEGRVIDVIGQILTPGLLIAMVTLIIKVIVSPIGSISDTGLQNSYHLGFVEGYQTMDALGGALLCGIVLTDLINKGYTERKVQRAMLIKVGILAGVLLAFVYGGLTYLGATTSSAPAYDRVALLLNSVQVLFGQTGGILLGIIVALACLTTAVGLTSTCGNFFETASNKKISYRLVVILTVVFSTLMSLLSVSGIVALAIPILSTIYPMVAVLILLTLFDRYITYDISYVGAVGIAGVIGFIEAMYSTFGSFQELHGWLGRLPLADAGFPWVVPALIFLALFTLIGIGLKGKDSRERRV